MCLANLLILKVDILFIYFNKQIPSTSYFKNCLIKKISLNLYNNRPLLLLLTLFSVIYFLIAKSL